MWTRLVVLAVWIVLSGHTYGQTNYSDRVSNYETFVNLYKRNNVSFIDIIPKEDLSTSAINVNVTLVLHALFDFDELGGSLEMAASVRLSWYDEMIQINHGPSMYSTVYTLSNSSTYDSLMVQYDKMWTPKLVLGNTVDKFSRIGDAAYMCRYDLTSGLVSWQPKFLLKSTCSPDVTYYPFDKQDCTFTILSWGHSSSEVMFTSTRDTWDMDSYEGNGEWEVEDTGSRSYVTALQSVFELNVSLKRNPLYFAFNIIVPVLVLSFLNGAVFWLPIESGERVGFSITCFLTFMVLLSTILGYLPATSSTMSFLCYYVVVMMMFSGLVTAFVVLNLYIYHKDEQGTVPGCLKAFIRFWRFRWFFVFLKCKNQKEEHTNTNASTSVIDIRKETNQKEEHTNTNASTSVIDIRKETNQQKPKIVLSGKMLMKLESKQERLPTTDAWREMSEDKDDDNITWKDFSRFLDIFLFIAFLSVEGFFSVTFLVPLAHRA